MKLRPYQEAALEGTRAALRAGAKSVVIQMPTGCHAKGQPIMMSDRSIKLVEDILPGDQVMGPNGRARVVQGVIQGRQEMARIIPDRGNPWDVNLDHVLTLAIADRLNVAAEIAREQTRWTDITVAEWLRQRQPRAWLMRADLRTMQDDEGPRYRLDGFKIELRPEAAYYGFELDGDGRYLLGDGTVTHNSGKSVLFSRMIAGVVSKGKRAMLLVQGQNLVRQAAKHLSALGVSVGIEMGDDRVGPRIGARGLIDDAPQIVVASRDSLARRLKHYPRDFFRMIVVDEVHHCLSAQYLDILEHFGVSVPRDNGKTKALGDTVVIGLTATPDRGDHGNIMTLFEQVGFSYKILEAIDDGWLVPIQQELVTLPGLDLSKVRRSAGDLNARDLEEVIRPLLEPICRDIVRVADGRPTLIYNPLVTMANATMMALGKTKGSGRVVTVTAETEEREALFKAMSRGEVWAFSSVGTLTEGVDIPCATIGAMLRPTSSRPLYAQIMGRILRPAEDLAHALNDMGSAAERRAAIAASSKPRAWMLDFAGNSGKHKLIHVVDVIGEGEEDKVMSLAKGHMGRGVTDPLEAIAKAKAELADMLARAAGGEVERILVDPFALFSVKAKKDTFERPVTEAQIDALLNAGAVEVKINSEKSREKAREAVRKRFDLLTASAMLDESSRRMRAGEASLRQVRRLVKAGLSPDRARTISFQDARRAIDELERQEWKTSPAWIARHSGEPAPVAGAQSGP